MKINEKGKMTSPYGPYGLGYTCATMVNTIRSYKVNLWQDLKFTFSSNYRL